MKSILVIILFSLSNLSHGQPSDDMSWEHVSTQCFAKMALDYTSLVSGVVKMPQESVVQMGICMAKKTAINFDSIKCTCKGNSETVIKKCMERTAKSYNSSVNELVETFTRLCKKHL